MQRDFKVDNKRAPRSIAGKVGFSPEGLGKQQGGGRNSLCSNQLLLFKDSLALSLKSFSSLKADVVLC